MKSSKEIREALDGWEGNVLTCYLDPIGIPTIGKGFTNASSILTAALGKLKPGVTKITAKQSDKIFLAMLSDEYEPLVKMSGAAQHEFDVGVSLVWNLGGRSQNWKWAKLWRAGEKQRSADYLAVNYNTAGGKRLPGLVRRRKEEAKILISGKYPNAHDTVKPEGSPRRKTANKSPDPVTYEAQGALAKLGIDPGEADGWYGAKTKAAVLLYQGQHPHLQNDGVLGPATLAQLRRDVGLLKTTATKGVGVIGSTGAVTWGTGLPVSWIVAGVGVVVIGVIIYFGWKYRDVWARRINKLTGKIIKV